jgi:hypothetical protein
MRTEDSEVYANGTFISYNRSIQTSNFHRIDYGLIHNQIFLEDGHNIIVEILYQDGGHTADKKTMLD